MPNPNKPASLLDTKKENRIAPFIKKGIEEGWIQEAGGCESRVDKSPIEGSITASQPAGGYITECPKCGSKDLKDESGFIMEGVSCKSCGWADIDSGIDSGC